MQAHQGVERAVDLHVLGAEDEAAGNGTGLAGEEREERLAGTAQMEARKAALAAKQEMVEKAYELALKKLCSPIKKC